MSYRYYEHFFSPWGEVHSVEKMQDGVYFISTASHGGFAIDKDLAEKELSPTALAFAEKTNAGGWYFFEEDCGWMAPATERPVWFKVAPENTPTLVKHLQRYFPSFKPVKGSITS